MSLDCRLLGPEDAPLLDRVAAEVFDEPIHQDRVRAFLSDPAAFLVVALDGTLVVGQCAAVHRHVDRPTDLFIENLRVAPAWQRRGLGAALLRQALEEGRRRGCGEAWVGTEPGNAAANAVYRSLGAAPAERFNLYLLPI